MTGSNCESSQFYSAAVDFPKTIIFYYIAWVFIGNWVIFISTLCAFNFLKGIINYFLGEQVLFNLFVAILIMGVSEEKTKAFKGQEEEVSDALITSCICVHIQLSPSDTVVVFWHQCQLFSFHSTQIFCWARKEAHT